MADAGRMVHLLEGYLGHAHDAGRCAGGREEKEEGNGKTPQSGTESR